MRTAILTLALAGLFGMAAPTALQAAEGLSVPVQTVGIAVPWRGWGVYRPYGAPLGYNSYYGGGYYRPYYNSYGYGSYYRPYAYGYRPYGFGSYYGGYAPAYSYGGWYY